MVNNGKGSFIERFISVFILLFVLAVVLPILVDQAVYLFSDGMIPRNNSIIVFKDFYKDSAAISKFVGILKKLIKFM